MTSRLCLAGPAAFAALLGAPAWAAPQITDVSGWKVIRAANSCGMSRDFPAAGGAPTGLMIVTEHRRQTTHVVLTNADWTEEANSAHTLNYELGDFLYRMPAVGLRSGEVSGFEADVSENFLYDFAYADDLKVSKDGMPIGRMDLRGGYAAIVAFRECVAAMRATE